MNPERWRQITSIFQAALARDAESRASFLAEECASDDELRGEVEAMIASHEQASQFIEEPALVVAAKQFVDEGAAWLVGRAFAHYRVLSLLGVGGMGEVYLAEDTRLGRKVALKLLPADLAGDEHRVLRFQLEARAASALNHPNIIVVHDIGEVAGRHYIATEFVEGETLRARLNNSSLKVGEALNIAVQVASALAAAHAAGIVHRDIKPENLMIRPDGLVKALDFGIAKLGGRPATAGISEAPTGSQVRTEPGLLVGTATYMSPEQARGREVDGRTDVWSLGVVLYEMAAGRVPFEGETTSDTIAALLRSEPPPITHFAPEVPAELQRIVTKALEKDREARYQSAKDLAVDLKSLSARLERGAGVGFSAAEMRGADAATSTAAHGAVDTTRESRAHTASSGGTTASILRRHRKGVAVALGATVFVALLLLAFLAALRFYSKLADSPKHSAAAPNLKITRLTPDLHALATGFTPDGKHVIYVQIDKGKPSVWLKDLATGGATQILPPHDAGYQEPQFSRDGKWIYYGTTRPNKPNRTLVRVPFAGGTMEEIALNVISPFTFSPDDKQIAFINGDTGDLHIVNADGSGERVLAKHDAKKGWFESWGSNLSWSSIHNLIAICGGRYGADGKPHYKLLLINPADGTEQIVPTPEWNYLDDVRWLGDGSGFIVCARETEASPYQVWHVAYPDGATRRITSDLDDYTNLALSPDSRQILTNRYLAHLNLWLTPTDAPAQARQISFGSAAEDGNWGMAFTPDGKIIYTSPRGGAVDLWQMNADGGEQKQLTKNAGELNAQPRVTPDGKTIVFVSTRSGRNQIWRMDGDGGNPKQLTDEFWVGEPALSPDGKEIYFKIDDSDKAYIAKSPLDGGEPVRVSKTPHNSGAPLVSPDGKLIFCQFYARDSVQPWKTGILNTETGELVKVFDFFISSTAVWMLDSKALIYCLRHDANLWRIALEADAKPQQLTNFDGSAIRTFAVSPDFKQFVISRGTATYEAVLLENF